MTALRATLLSLLLLAAGCAGLLPTRRYVVEPAVMDPESHSVVWYEHVSGPGIGTVPGDEEVHVVLCNERIIPPCVRLEIDDIDAGTRRAILDRLEAARANACGPAPEASEITEAP